MKALRQRLDVLERTARPVRSPRSSPMFDYVRAAFPVGSSAKRSQADMVAPLFGLADSAAFRRAVQARRNNLDIPTDLPAATPEAVAEAEAAMAAHHGPGWREEMRRLART